MARSFAVAIVHHLITFPKISNAPKDKRAAFQWFPIYPIFWQLVCPHNNRLLFQSFHFLNS